MGGLEKFETTYVFPADGPTLIVGSKIYDEKEDRRKRYANAIGVDMQGGEGVDWVWNLEHNPPAEWDAHFMHVECMSILEHTACPWLVASSIERVLARGGTLFVSVPWVWRQHFYPEDNWRISPEGLRHLFPSINWLKVGLATQRKVFLETPKGYPSLISDKGDKYLMRSETVGFGVRV